MWGRLTGRPTEEVRPNARRQTGFRRRSPPISMLKNQRDDRVDCPRNRPRRCGCESAWAQRWLPLSYTRSCTQSSTRPLSCAGCLQEAITCTRYTCLSCMPAMDSLKALQRSLHELRRLVHTTLLCAATERLPHELGELSRHASQLVVGRGWAGELIEDPQHISSDIGRGKSQELRRPYANFFASLASLLAVDVADPAFGEVVQRFACELEVLIRAVDEVIRKPPSDGVGDFGTEWTPGSPQPDRALSLLSDVAEKSHIAKQALEVAMLKWGTAPSGTRGASGRER